LGPWVHVALSRIRAATHALAARTTTPAPTCLSVRVSFST
jgi:hypothetical protein